MGRHGSSQTKGTSSAGKPRSQAVVAIRVIRAAPVPLSCQLATLDWGRDLPALRDFVEGRHLNRRQLLCFGRVDPALYGIDYRVPYRGADSTDPEAGCLA